MYENNPVWIPHQGKKIWCHSDTKWFMEIMSPRFPVECIDDGVMQQIISEMKKRGKQNGTCNRVIATSQAVLNYCYKRKQISKGPWYLSHNKLPETKGRLVTYTVADALRMVKTAKAHRFPMWNDMADFIKASAFTGCRQGELLALRCGDVLWDSGNLQVWQPKPKQYRMLPIERKLVLPILEERCRDMPDDEYIFGNDWLNRDQNARVFRDVRDLAFGGEKRYPLHVLRNCFVSVLAKLGYAAVDICRIMAHSSIAVTERYMVAYSNVQHQMIADLSSLLENEWNE